MGGNLFAWTAGRTITMIWFTSDLHFGHEAIIKMRNRPFADADDMNNALIHNINSCVQPNDKLYILGDVSHHITPEATNALVKKLRGHKYLIYGNHDLVQNPEVCPYNPSLFVSEGYYLKLRVDRMTLILMHYPMLSWDKARAGSIMLHGHIHAGPEYNEQNRKNGICRFDVGVDANSYYPVSLLQIRTWAEEAGRHHSEGGKPVDLNTARERFNPGE